jgi:hypothetical protein
MTDLDRDRSNGRTAVQQCWDYINAVPGCIWGIAPLAFILAAVANP